MTLKNLAFVDIETTGLSINRDRIIEIGIIRMENGKVVENYASLVKPGINTPFQITQITGINTCDLEKAPMFTSISKEVYKLLKDCIFVAHNARFDYGFIKNAFKREEKSYISRQLCTVKLARELFPNLTRFNLDTLISVFNLECKNRHRAFDDADVLRQFYEYILKNVDIGEFEKVISSIVRKPSIPSLLHKSEIDNLPHSPGVYVFYDKNNVPLYIGKSKDISDRVQSHFYNDYTTAVDMKISQQIARIQTIATAGELGALLKESFTIKTMQPIYNKKLRMKKKLNVLFSEKNPAGYNTITLKEVDIISHLDFSKICGIFISKRSANEALSVLIKKYHLCEKLTGLENTKSSCFAYRLGICKGACLGKENPLFYNVRHVLAFSQHKIKPWPFEGPVCISETGDNGNEEYFIVDNWCLVGIYDNLNFSEPLKSSAYNFDVDTYKILKSYLLSKGNASRVRLLKDYGVDKVFQSL